MKILLFLSFITGSTIAFPQYGGNVQVDVEEISQKEVIPEHPEHPVEEHVEHLKDPEHPKTDEITELVEQIKNPEDPQNSDFNREQQEKLSDYWWKVSGVFGGDEKDRPSEIEPGLGVGGPFTPQQSKFCEIGFDCVPYEICVDGAIALHGQTILEQRIKPTNYETNQCGQEGNICCGIPEEVLVAHRENIGTITDITGDKIEPHQPHVGSEGPINPVSSIVEIGENYDSSSHVESTKVIEEGKTGIDKPVSPVDLHEPVLAVNSYGSDTPVAVDTNIQTNENGNLDISINVEIRPDTIEPGVNGFHESSVHKPSLIENGKDVDGEHDHLGTGIGEIPESPVHTSTVIKNENSGVGGYGPSATGEAEEPLVNSPVIHGHSDSSPSVVPIKPGHVGEIDACGDASLTCVPYFQCVEGVINVDGTGLIDVRIKPQSVCEHPDFPNVPGVCCRKPGYDPAPAPISQCPKHQECLYAERCPSEGDNNTDGRGKLDLRTGYKKCHGEAREPGICCDVPSIPIETCPEKSVCVSKLKCFGQALNNVNKFIDFADTGSWVHCSEYSDGVCCLQPERITLDVCPGNSQCVKEEFCSDKALDGNGKLVDYASGGSWSYCSVEDGTGTGICCSSEKPDILEGCPGKSKCTLAGQCSGEAVDSSGNIVSYPSNGLWRQCALGTSYGICCIQTESVFIEKCPGNSVCLSGDQCLGQAIDETGKFVDYATGGSWSSCVLDNVNGVCCVPPAPVIRETCPEGSKCILGNKCNGLALDGNNNFINYEPSGSWSYCSLNPESGICCKEEFPTKLVDVCPLQSVCLRPEQCIGKAMDAENNFIDYAKNPKEIVWTHCSEYDGGVCCQNPEAPKDPGYLQPAPLCGIRNYNIDERITSNKVPNEATFGEFPWQSIIFYQNYTFVCGATLVSNKFVVTAAHCLTEIKPQDIKIRFGEWIVSSTEEVLPYVDRNVYKIHIHPEFNPKNVHKDFAVIELEKPVEFQYHINSVCIPHLGYMVEPYSQCFTTGWGKDSFEGTFQSTLKKIDLPFIEHEKCQNLLRRTRLGKYFRLDPSFTCAGGEENKDACYGDGGGPLVCKDKGSSQYQLIGITSWGIGCGQKDIPGVYADVPEYSNWIKNIINIQEEGLPEQFKESLGHIVEETAQAHREQGHDLEQGKQESHHHEEHFEGIEGQVKEDHPQEGPIEDFAEQVKEDHHQDGHIESVPEAPAPSYGK